MLVIPAYAKLNLALEVVARRSDGWHDIDTLIVPIDWHDLVGVEVVNDSDVDGPPAVAVTRSTSPGGDAAAHAIAPHDNLAAKAAALLVGLAPGHQMRLRVWLEKRIPIAGGLGGGSADAAATLRAGARLLARHGVDVDGSDLADAARELGSDVPALLERHAVRATGRGEHVSRVTIRTLDCVVVFVAPSFTHDVYAAVLRDECRDTGRITRLAGALAAGSGLDDELLGSALEAAAFRINPELASGAARLRSALPDVAWHMTGSGGAFFAMARDPVHAAALAGTARTAGFASRACRTMRGSG